MGQGWGRPLPDLGVWRWVELWVPAEKGGVRMGIKATTLLRPSPLTLVRSSSSLFRCAPLIAYPRVRHPPPASDLRAVDRPGGATPVLMDSSGQRILLVEDSELNRIVVRRLVRELNVDLEEAENGLVAVDLIRQGKTYDLVLMDKDMPVMDGHQATRQLRSLGVTTPIVALSADNLQSDRDRFFQAGADEFLAKPLSKHELVRVLTKYGLDQ